MLLANVGLEACKHVLAAHCALSLDIVHANPRFLEKEAFRQVRFMFLLDNDVNRQIVLGTMLDGLDAPPSAHFTMAARRIAGF
jgi:hypothetical protein